MPDSLRGSKSGWGKKLLEALTRDQIETLLDVLAETGALLRLPEELHAVDSDLADMVQRLVGKAEISAASNPDEALETKIAGDLVRLMGALERSRLRSRRRGRRLCEQAHGLGIAIFRSDGLCG